MANPQKEQGFTPIATELLEGLCRTKISGEARQMLDVIIRKTYGFSKSEDRISTTQFTKLTNLSSRSIYKARRKLKEMNIITVSQKGDSQVLTYRIQKDYDKWVLSPKRELPPKSDTTISQKRHKLPPKSDTQITIDNTIDTITIDIIQSFTNLWEKYPERIGRKAAERYFKASVKTQEDYNNINKALDNYLKCDRVKKGFIQNGSTWFNDWQSWVNYKPSGSGRRLV